MQKYTVSLAVILIALSLFPVSCERSSKTSSTIVSPDKPIAVEGKENLFQAGRIYFCGQPDEEMLHWLAGEEIEVVINLRTDKEMETHMKEKFDEDSLITNLGMTYFQFPVGGDAGYSTQVVDTLAYVLDKHQGRAFIHCKIGGRVSYVWVAYLIRHKNVPIDEAIDIGKRMKFKFLLEDLIGYSLSMRKKE